MFFLARSVFAFACSAKPLWISGLFSMAMDLDRAVDVLLSIEWFMRFTEDEKKERIMEYTANLRTEVATETAGPYTAYFKRHAAEALVDTALLHRPSSRLPSRSAHRTAA